MLAISLLEQLPGLQSKAMAGTVVPSFPSFPCFYSLLCKQKVSFHFYSLLYMLHTYIYVHVAFCNPVQTFLGIKSVVIKTKITEPDISRETTSHETIRTQWKKHSVLHIFRLISMQLGAPRVQRKLCSNHPALCGCHAL